MAKFAILIRDMYFAEARTWLNENQSPRLLDHRDQEIGNLLRWRCSPLIIFHRICIALQHIERQAMKPFAQDQPSQPVIQGGFRAGNESQGKIGLARIFANGTHRKMKA